MLVSRLTPDPQATCIGGNSAICTLRIPWMDYAKTSSTAIRLNLSASSGRKLLHLRPHCCNPVVHSPPATVPHSDPASREINPMDKDPQRCSKCAHDVLACSITQNLPTTAHVMKMTKVSSRKNTSCQDLSPTWNPAPSPLECNST